MGRVYRDTYAGSAVDHGLAAAFPLQDVASIDCWRAHEARAPAQPACLAQHARAAQSADLLLTGTACAATWRRRGAALGACRSMTSTRQGGIVHTLCPLLGGVPCRHLGAGRGEYVGDVRVQGGASRGLALPCRLGTVHGPLLHLCLPWLMGSRLGPPGCAVAVSVMGLAWLQVASCMSAFQECEAARLGGWRLHHRSCKPAFVSPADSSPSMVCHANRSRCSGWTCMAVCATWHIQNSVVLHTICTCLPL